jgi:hypothetical protein
VRFFVVLPWMPEIGISAIVNAHIKIHAPLLSNRSCEQLAGYGPGMKQDDRPSGVEHVLRERESHL